MGPKWNHKCPHKEAERDRDLIGEEGVGDIMKKARGWSDVRKGSWPGTAGGLQKPEEAREQTPSQSFQKEHICQHLGLILENFMSYFWHLQL